MNKSRSGFTLVEIFVVITVIAILTTIVVVAYNGIQSRARDSKRLTDAQNIIKALRLYESDEDIIKTSTYPPTSASPSAGGCASNGMSNSWAKDGTWLKDLVATRSIDAAPVPPGSSCTMTYSYIAPAANAYGCASRTTPYFVLIVQAEGSMSPAGSKTFTPCAGSSQTWTASKNTWVFASDNLSS